MSQGKEKGLMIGGVHAPILEKMLPGVLRENLKLGGGMSQRRSTQGLMIGGVHAPILEKMLPGILREKWYGHPKLDVEKPRRKYNRGLAIGGVAAQILQPWLEQIKGGPSSLSEQLFEQLPEQKIAQTKKPIDLFE